MAATQAGLQLADERCAAHDQRGKQSLIGWFVGQVMRKSRGKADPQLVRSILEGMLSQE
jgi:Asp-tRNA(Asn)/Glu-tRNA(Gln) amidotransferase B subunit